MLHYARLNYVLSVLAGAALWSVLFYEGLLCGTSGDPFRTGFLLVVAGVLFWIRALSPAGTVWVPWRSRLMALGCWLWGLYLILFSLHYTNWIIDILFVMLALCFWLARHRAEFLIASLGILWAIGARHWTGGGGAVILGAGVFPAAALLGGGRWADKRLSSRVIKKPPRWSPGSVAAAVAVFAFLVYHAARPAMMMVAPEKRRVLLEALSPRFPISDPARLPPLAGRLRRHVEALASGIGERSAYQAEAQAKTMEYIIARFREAGYLPETQGYEAGRKTDFQRSKPYFNISAVLAGNGASGEGVWVVGAHYDSAPGTPGADDNASGVAVLLEVARLLKDVKPGREIRFVAFDSEEPPAFGTRDMGSYRYARDLKARGIKVHGMLNLEMLGYFNPRPASQLFPPFLHLIYPDQANFIGLVSNLSSMGLAATFKKSWKKTSQIPMEMTVLPAAFSALALSDQLNFWHEGYPALMLSDTGFFRYPQYHQNQDTPEKLDYERMADVALGVVHALSTNSR